MRVSEVIERLQGFPDYWDVPDVVDVRAETRVTHGRDLDGRRVREGAVVVVIC